MKRHRRLLWSLGLSALMGLMASETQAGSINLSVDLNGTVIYTTSSVSPDQNVAAILIQVNAALVANGSAYQFTGLNAQSNFSGGSIGSLQTTFQLNTSNSAGTTAAVLSIDTTQSGFLAPVGPNGVLTSTAGGSYNTASGSLSFTGNFQGGNSPTVVFPVSGTDSYSGTNMVGVGSVPSGYELSNHFLISLSKGPNVFLGGTGGVTVAAAAVPEPSSVVTMMMGMPMSLAFMGLLRLRRKAKA